MKILETDVRHVAKLSKLAFTDEETKNFAMTLSKIVDMVELLKEVDTTDVPSTTTMAETRNVMRDDVAEKGWNREELFKNVPSHENNLIKVPAMLDGGGDA
ncbi:MULTISPECIES: Asp-tRNA(Asn)/Glu-tRNA(Gln) amidotransferase subunit GatC [unclassified Streptococcus]|uniref:Asp-tRNA(Asn)/Glu-tRNA(Gln) amidotransferase subunit GatC n=1 Tax=unclassified Streptococcus TaxID=2608887 RepID=UPI00359DD196